jgi:hypothetical protein
MQEWHGIRDTVVMDKKRIRLTKEPRKDGRSGQDIRRNQKASMEQGTETQDSNYIRGRRGQLTTSDDGAEDRSHVWEAGQH